MSIKEPKEETNSSGSGALDKDRQLLKQSLTLDRYNAKQLDEDSDAYVRKDVEKMRKKRTELLWKVAMASSAHEEDETENSSENKVDKIKKAYEQSKKHNP